MFVPNAVLHSSDPVPRTAALNVPCAALAFAYVGEAFTRSQAVASPASAVEMTLPLTPVSKPPVEAAIYAIWAFQVNAIESPDDRLITANVADVNMFPTVAASNRPASSTARVAVAVTVPVT